MKLMDKLTGIWSGLECPFLIHSGQKLTFSDISSQHYIDLSSISCGDVVAIIGGFNPFSISTLIKLIDIGAIVVPLTTETQNEHEYFFQSALVDVIIDETGIRRRDHGQTHEFIEVLRARGHAGLILFSTGTTGRPKAILHDMTLFLERFNTPRPALATVNFLLFDHIGGINTLFHTMFNRGVVVSPEDRTVYSILDVCRRYNVKVLPTTPTFLRIMLLSGVVPDSFPDCIEVVTYGTERMDQPTLDDLCHLLPKVDFRQTFGMSELGIVRVKSESRDSLYMKVGGEGVETKVVDNVLWIRSSFAMIGYLNAPSPFDKDGWYDTKDVVDIKNGFYKIIGRIGDVINVGGLKFMASDVERVALMFPDVLHVKVVPKSNPITGQHVELLVQPVLGKVLDRDALVSFMKKTLQPHMVPKRVRIQDIAIGHRFKKV